MRPKSLALLLLALGCGLVASVGITQVMAKRNAESTGLPGEMQSIFVAISEIALGDSITSALVKLEEWPKDKVPQGAISRLEDVEGRRARTKFYPGEPILEHKLLGKGASGQGATALIPKGYRVVPVKVDLVSGGSSLILPGDRVDVMVHLVHDASREIQETITRTILQDIKVFAVDDVVDLEREKDNSKKIAAKTISLLVTPKQAAELTQATQMGTINLVMRSPEDDQQTPNVEARPSDLFAGSAKAERDKETLLPADPNLREKTTTFLEFLGSAKAKAPAEGATSVGATPANEPPKETWNMRVLKPGEVQDVEFEADVAKDGAASPAPVWKSTAMAGNAAGAPPKAEPKPTPPKPVEPPPPKPRPKADRKDKSTN